MKTIDLTHLIKEKMTVYPGTEPPIIVRATSLESDGFREAKISMYSHTGTHIDAPAHMIRGGKYLDELSTNSFIGSATVIDVTQLNVIDDIFLLKYENILNKIDFVIFKTGYERYWGSNEYFGKFQTLTIKAAEYLTKYNLKGIGVDAISIDSMDTIDFPIHNILLSKNIISIENLCNLDSIDRDEFILSVLPLKLIDADGSPVRAIAILEEF